MNRKIKFRGKDKDDKWQYGYLFKGKDENDNPYALIFNQKRYVCDENLPEKYPIAFGVDEVVPVLPDTIGQFTGLQDKNREDIYEGDIIRSVRFKDIILLVVYDEKEGAFMAVQINKNRGTDLETRCHITQEWLDKFPKEVIGNMYDNPELLEE